MNDAASSRAALGWQADYQTDTDTDGFRALKPGRNCWRICSAARVGFMIDGADYFRILRAALLKAETSVLITGWDFDPNIRLDPINHPDESLGGLLAAIT